MRPVLKLKDLCAGMARPGQADRPESSEAAPAGEIPMRQLLLDFTRAPAPTFANFVHGANAELFDALSAAARGDAPERVIYIWGESGAGKTHLAKAFETAVFWMLAASLSAPSMSANSSYFSGES